LNSPFFKEISSFVFLGQVSSLLFRHFDLAKFGGFLPFEIIKRHNEKQ